MSWTIYDADGAPKLGLTGGGSGVKTVEIFVTNDADDITAGDAQGHIWTVPDALDGMNLVDAQAAITDLSSSGDVVVQIRNITDTTDMLTDKITIDQGDYNSYSSADPSVIDTGADDVSVGDRIAFDVDSAGTDAKGLTVILSFS